MLRHTDTLAASLGALGLAPRRGGSLEGFAGDQQPVELQVTLADGLVLGWQRGSDGSLALVADLQRLSRSRDLEPFLSRLTRAYAAREALLAASLHLSTADVRIGV